MRKINLSNENEVREKVLSGAKKMADLIGLTLGPAGRSILIERGRGEPLIVDDGRRAAEDMKLDDPIEHLVVRIIYNVTRKTDEAVGDGTSTAMLLTYAIIKDVFEKYLPFGGLAIAKGDVNKLDARLKKAKDEVLSKLDGMTKQIKTKNELINVATIVSNDKEIGELIGGMYHKMGKDGHITMEFNLISHEIETKIVPGLRFSGGFADKFMITNLDRLESVLNDTHILITECKKIDRSMIDPLSAEVSNSGKKNMVIIAPKFTNDFLSVILKTAVKSNFFVLCVRAPSIHTEHYKDIAIWTGGKHFTDKDDLKEATLDDLGYVQKIEVTDDTCQLVEGGGNKIEIAMRIKEVKEEARLQKLPQFKQSRLERISAMSKGVGLIKIGAPTDDERNWLKYTIDDTRHATKHAFRDGVVPGGGMTFKKIAESLPDDNILKKALMIPYETLKANSGGNFKVGKDIFDPVAVEKAALETAVSAASKLIRIGGAIVYRPKTDAEEVLRNLQKSEQAEEDEDDD